MAVLRDLQGVFHDPYGSEHPYEQMPFERVPRAPLAGQPVALRVTTWPPGAAQAVWASWKVDDTDETGAAEGHWVADDEARSCWRVQLPAFRYGQRVSYCLHARQDQRLS